MTVPDRPVKSVYRLKESKPFSIPFISFSSPACHSCLFSFNPYNLAFEGSYFGLGLKMKINQLRSSESPECPTSQWVESFNNTYQGSCFWTTENHILIYFIKVDSKINKWLQCLIMCRTCEPSVAFKVYSLNWTLSEKHGWQCTWGKEKKSCLRVISVNPAHVTYFIDPSLMYRAQSLMSSVWARHWMKWILKGLCPHTSHWGPVFWMETVVIMTNNLMKI